MADLTDLQASQSIKITGSDSSGIETNFVDATVNGLKVDGSAVTQPISAASLPLPTGAATETTLASIDSKVTAYSQVASGTLTALNQAVTLSTIGLSSVVIQTTGTFTATYTIEATVDGTNYTAVNCSTQGGNTSAFSAARGDIVFPCGGYTAVRTRISAFTSGSVVTTMRGSISSANAIKIYQDNTTTLFAQTNTRDGNGNILTSQANGTQRALDVGINVAGVQIDPRSVTLQTGTNTIGSINNISGTISLPTGAATETTLSALNTNSTNGAQKTQIVDSLGNSIDSIKADTFDTLMVSQSATGFISSTANSTTTQLAAGATFTGTIETIFNQQAISILLTSDKTGTLIINQYIDAAGTRRISQWTYSIAANVPFSRSFTGNGNYFNLTFQNTAATATTTLNINTAYGTLLPSSNLGNLTVSLDEINGTALTAGQKTAANSIPVIIASDQSAIPITGTITSTPGLGNKATYIANTGIITGATATGLKSLFYLFHPITNTKKVSIIQVIVDQIAGNGGAGTQTIELYRLTAENVTPGGTSVTANSADPAETATTLTTRATVTGAPTRVAQSLESAYIDPKNNGQVILVGQEGQYSVLTKPYLINTLTAGGYEVVQNVNTALSAAPKYIVTIQWTEE